MQATQQRLNMGDWVHVFPEGTRSVDGRMGQARRGVGRLIAACQQPPMGVLHMLSYYWISCSAAWTECWHC